jgi:hypothetical protein
MKYSSQSGLRMEIIVFHNYKSSYADDLSGRFSEIIKRKRNLFQRKYKKHSGQKI